jgi:hypothetical protein
MNVPIAVKSFWALHLTKENTVLGRALTNLKLKIGRQRLQQSEKAC